MEHTEFGRLIGKYDTKLSDVFLRRILGSIIPIALIILIIYVEISRDTPFSPNAGWIVIFSALLFWVMARMFLRKMYCAEIYEGGVVLTQKTRRKIKQINFNDLEYVTHGFRTITLNFIPIWRYREVRIAFADEPIKGLGSVFRNIKTAWSIDIAKANIANLKQFGDTITEAYDKHRAGRG